MASPINENDEYADEVKAITRADSQKKKLSDQQELLANKINEKRVARI